MQTKPVIADVDEPIIISDYDPMWPELFTEEERRVQTALAELVTRIEHFGSTAVPGMAGKPIIDLLVGVPHLAIVSTRISPLEALGYQNFGEIFIPGRLYLRRRGPPHFNVAVTREGGDFWHAQLVMRDYLRAHPREVAAYSECKRSAYANGARMFSSYSQTKVPFLAAITERARKWHESKS